MLQFYGGLSMLGLVDHAGEADSTLCFPIQPMQNSYAATIITEMICDFKWDFTPFQKSAVQDSFMDKQNKNKKSPILRKLKFPSGSKLSDFEAYKVDFCKQ